MARWWVECQHEGTWDPRGGIHTQGSRQMLSREGQGPWKEDRKCQGQGRYISGFSSWPFMCTDSTGTSFLMWPLQKPFHFAPTSLPENRVSNRGGRPLHPVLLHKASVWQRTFASPGLAQPGLCFPPSIPPLSITDYFPGHLFYPVKRKHTS